MNFCGKVNIFSTDFQRLPSTVQDALRDLEKVSAHCTSFTMNVCLSYGARAEIVDVIKEIATNVQANSVSISSISEDMVSKLLLTRSIPGKL